MPRKTQISTASKKAKGRTHQQYIRDECYRVFGALLEDGDIESTSMGKSGVDLQFSPKARKLIPLSIEAKSTKKHPTQKDFKQAQNNVKPNTIPALCWKPHGALRKDTMIAMNLTEFLELLRSFVYKEEVNGTNKGCSSDQ